jgi:hypothetical protein
MRTGELNPLACISRPKPWPLEVIRLIWISAAFVEDLTTVREQPFLNRAKGV